MPAPEPAMPLAATAAFVAMNALAVWWDIRTRRIPNALTLTGVAVGLILRAGLGWAAIAHGLLGVGLALLVSVPLFALGALGGGDAKLLAAIGAFMGPERLVGALLVIGVLGGVFALVDAARRRALGPVLVNTYDLMRHWVTFGHRGASRSLASPGAAAIPYGVPIALGALGWWIVGMRSV